MTEAQTTRTALHKALGLGVNVNAFPTAVLALAEIVTASLGISFVAVLCSTKTTIGDDNRLIFLYDDIALCHVDLNNGSSIAVSP